MAKIGDCQSGTPVNDSERAAIKFLRDNLPDTYILCHNFELIQHQDRFEIDIALIAPHSVFLIDVKGTRGSVSIAGNRWYPEGRPWFHSPLSKLNNNARILKTLVTNTFPGIKDLKNIHVHAVVLMTAPDSEIHANGSPDEADITFLDQRGLTYFKGKGHIPTNRLQDIRSYHTQITQAIKGTSEAVTGPPCFRDWQAVEKLTETDDCVEYRAKHLYLGDQMGTAHLKVYRVDPYLDQVERTKQRQLLSNAYLALRKMPPHSHIVQVRNFFPNEAADCFILELEDCPGNSLRQHIHQSGLTLTLEQKIIVLQQVLTGLNHAHKAEVIHRNFTPDAVLITPQGDARITNFDYARVTKNRAATIASEIVDSLDPAYQAPECYRDPSQASIASDLFSAGLVFYELLTRQAAFEDASQIFDRDAQFPNRPSQLYPDLPEGLDNWLQKLCAFDPEDRYISAAVALNELNTLLTSTSVAPPPLPDYDLEKPLDLLNLQREQVLDKRFMVQEQLGKGGFAVVYKVNDLWSDSDRVLKIVTKDRESVYDRLIKEYKTLKKVPPHPHVVEVEGAGRFPQEDAPWILFNFVDGFNVETLLEQNALSLEDAVALGQQTANGLVHLHDYSVYHLDIKPSNLLWTSSGIRIIDFNVSVSADDEDHAGGGTWRYIPPDYSTQDTSDEAKIDRDLYALGITFYECMTGKHPYANQLINNRIPKNKTAPDPRQYEGCQDLTEELVAVMLKVIAPTRSQRYGSAIELEEGLRQIRYLRKLPDPVKTQTADYLEDLSVSNKPNFNPFVSHLQTLYSQSQRTNAGTRGLDKVGEATYIETQLDRYLQTAILQGEFQLVLISGNAGDGKTAFIQKLEQYAKKHGKDYQRGINGATFSFQQYQFRTNHDGSQDEGDKVNRDVLLDFLAPFQGSDSQTWNSPDIRIIAINEGRLIDFLQDQSDRFPALIKVVEAGLRGAEPTSGVVVINLNLRSVVADQIAEEGSTRGSILDQLIRRLTKPDFWQACQTCDLKDRCYVHHNAQTFQDPIAGDRVIERLKFLYTITHLRGRLHITLRDLRSAIAFMLAGVRNCDEIHQLYNSTNTEDRQKILDGFYFNAWIGGTQGSSDRLISLLRQIDLGSVNNPQLDRSFAFLKPDANALDRFSFSNRGHYENDLLERLFNDLNDDEAMGDRAKSDRYVAMLRRRYYFEARGETWKELLPYRKQSATQFLKLVKGQSDNYSDEILNLIQAINKGEGLHSSARLGKRLALRVRQVEKGTIRSYRLFDGDRLSLDTIQMPESITRFIEYLRQNITLHYEAPSTYAADLNINLDVYEMFSKLNQGYRPTVEEQQGFYLSLTVFKNMLASAPYQEVLLTETGQDFYRISRSQNGTLTLTHVQEVIQ